MERARPRQQAALDAVLGSVLRGWVTSSQFQNLLHLCFLHLSNRDDSIHSLEFIVED